MTSCSRNRGRRNFWWVLLAGSLDLLRHVGQVDTRPGVMATRGSGAGRLRVSTRVVDDGVVVEIGDSAAGMTPQVRAYDFESFFTTKGVGKGAGHALTRSGAEAVRRRRHGAGPARRSEPVGTVGRRH